LRPVENKVILELKTAEAISNAHKAKALNYLKATGVKLCLILNFGREKLQHTRLAN